jgi:hypothetical protein
MITRDNYEEFFLLYVDNELPENERRLVERWVADNPDLEEEWKALLQCRLEPGADERVVFADKESLMKKADRMDEGRPGDPDEENLLLYIDGELDEKDSRAVEELARHDASKQRELERLRRAVSSPDLAVVFPDKESLYRKEGRRIVLAAWWRIAAAAVVLGAVGLLMLQPWHRGTQGMRGGIVRASDVKREGGVEKKKDSPAVTPATASALHFTEAGTPKEPKKDLVKGVKADKGVAAEKQMPSQNTGLQEEIVRPAPPEERALAAVGERTTGDAIVAADPPTVNDPGKTRPSFDGAVALTEESIPKDKSSFATQALLASSTTESSDNSNSDIDTEPVSPKKNKLRGIFRKVTRTFEKTADRGEDGQRKILIGSFQFALK